MVAVREYAVDHSEWASSAEKLEGTPLPDPKPGEEHLVCTRCHSVRMQGAQIVLQAIYEEPKSLVLTVPPPVHLNNKP